MTAPRSPEPTALTPRAPSHTEEVRKVVKQLVTSQKLRKFAIKGQQWCDRRTEALIATELGYDAMRGDENSRKALFRRAANVRLAVEKTGEIPTDSGVDLEFEREDFVEAILSSSWSRQTWDVMRGKNETKMERNVKLLPVYAWAKEVRGFGALGLAIVTAEGAGLDKYIPGSETLRVRTIGEYRTVSGLWKRMGLAVINGERQRKVATKAGGEEQGYKPERRAECWVLTDSLLRAQMCSELRARKEAIAEDAAASAACEVRGVDFKGAKKVDALRPIIEEFGLEAQGHPTGPYGEVYARRKAHTSVRIELTADLPDKVDGRLSPLKWTPARCHADACRVMFKQLLADLRTEWRRASA